MYKGTWEDKKNPAIKVYICYSERDQALKNDLTTHLAPLERQGLISFWSKEKIELGTKSNEAIKNHLNMAQIILLLASPDFIASTDLYEREVLPAIERQKSSDVVIIPIVLRPCNWKSTHFCKFPALPRNHEPVSAWKNPDDAWCEIVEELQRKCEILSAHSDTSPSTTQTAQTPKAPHTHRSNSLLSTSAISYTFSNAFTEHTTPIWSLAFSPDGQYLASGGNDDTIKVWDMSMASQSYSLKNYTNATTSVAFSPDGHYLASSGDDGTIKLWDLSTREIEKTLRAHADWISCIIFSTDGHYLASGSDDRTIKIWEVPHGTFTRALQEPAEITRIVFNPNNQFIASGSAGQHVKLWEVSTGITKPFKESITQAFSLAFSPNGYYFATGNDDGSIIVWETATWKRIHTLTKHSDRIRCLAFHPDSHLLASGSDDQTIQLWDVTTGRAIQTLVKHTDRIECIVFSPDGQSLASGGRDAAIMLWKVS